MEQYLTDIESGDTNIETLDAIFRAVHSIKAGAGAFSFADLVAFSHTYEAFLDQLRSGVIDTNKTVIETLYRAGDVLSDLIIAARDDVSLGADHGHEIAAELTALLKAEGSDIAASTVTEKSDAAPIAQGVKSYEIRFKPNLNIFRNASEPLLLIRELEKLGELSIKADISKLPEYHLL